MKNASQLVADEPRAEPSFLRAEPSLTARARELKTFLFFNILFVKIVKQDSFLTCIEQSKVKRLRYYKGPFKLPSQSRLKLVNVSN